MDVKKWADEVASTHLPVVLEAKYERGRVVCSRCVVAFPCPEYSRAIAVQYLVIEILALRGFLDADSTEAV